jgi:squalene cyclase
MQDVLNGYKQFENHETFEVTSVLGCMWLGYFQIRQGGWMTAIEQFAELPAGKI